jgi:HSP20 family protein
MQCGLGENFSVKPLKGASTMNSLISRNYVPAFPVAVATQTRRVSHLVPRATVFETHDALIMELEMPGLTRESVEVTVENDELTIVGRRPTAVESNNSGDSDSAQQANSAPTVLLRERPEGDYRRTFVLGDRLDPSAITASMANGILTINIPKGERAKPRTIEIR